MKLPVKNSAIYENEMIKINFKINRVLSKNLFLILIYYNKVNKEKRF